jgi:hypothetical protein
VPWEPLTGRTPLHPLEAVHEAALVEFHISVEAAPTVTVVGLAVSTTIGAGTTLTVATATLLVPPEPVQVNEYEVVAVSAPVLWLPLGARVALQPPEAAHDVASVELQVSTEVPPLPTVVCTALMDAVGCGTPIGVTPAPPHAASINDEPTPATRRGNLRR